MFRRRLGIETLERRLLMAGNVTAQLKGGWLVVTGDDLGNQISIQNPSPGEYSVTGSDGTTVTGSPVAGVTKRIKVDLKKGDDTVAVVGSGTAKFQVSGDVSIKTGADDDRIVIASLQAAGKVTLSSGNATAATGGDQVLVTDSEVGKNLSVNTGSGHDKVGIGQGEPLDTMLADFLEEMELDGLGLLPGPVDVQGKLSVATGKGNDDLMIGDCTVGGSVSANAGGGTDKLLVQSTTVVGKASLNMGSGDEDYLGIQDNQVTGKVKLNGGSGKWDALDDLGGNSYPPLTKTPPGFEIFL